MDAIGEGERMRRRWLTIIGVLALCGMAGGFTMMRKASPEPRLASVASAHPVPMKPKPDTRETRVWQPIAGLKQVPIWPGPAPDLVRGGPPESVSVSDTVAAFGHVSEGVFDVSVPTMTVYPPKGRNTGVAIVVFPGGGFQVDVITSEGTEICDWLTSQGITCIVSKYRVPDSNHHWDRRCDCSVTPRVATALQDAQRTIRLVRAQAAALHVDPAKIGVIGFSAGAYLVAQTSNIFGPAYTPVDAADRVSSRPDFAIALYPGHLCHPGGKLDPGILVTKQTPPTFLLQAWDDPVDDICNSTVYARALDAAGVLAEVHLFARGGHAFTLRNKDHPVAMWPKLVEAWMRDVGVLAK